MDGARIDQRSYPVGALAQMAGVSVRTLHHYDEIGLLRPSGRSAAGYRQYAPADLQRLRQVLFYRELGFGLDAIAEILADPRAAAGDHLRRQHRLLRERIARDSALLSAIEQEMEARDMGCPLTPEEEFEVFGTSKIGEWQAEAESRWGDTEAWSQSQRRTAAYTKQDWAMIKAEAEATVRAFASAAESGQPATSEVAMDLAEQHRRHISRWFYDCGYATHRGLAGLYLADARFAATYDSLAPGLAQYVHDAIMANAERAAG